MAKKQSKLDFEGTLEELEALVEKMAGGELSLEDSLQAFERGIKLTREAQNVLKEAELRVRTLVETEAGPVLEDLDGDDLEAP